VLDEPDERLGRVGEVGRELHSVARARVGQALAQLREPAGDPVRVRGEQQAEERAEDDAAALIIEQALLRALDNVVDQVLESGIRVVELQPVHDEPAP